MHIQVKSLADLDPGSDVNPMTWYMARAHIGLICISWTIFAISGSWYILIVSRSAICTRPVCDTVFEISSNARSANVYHGQCHKKSQAGVENTGIVMMGSENIIGQRKDVELLSFLYIFIWSMHRNPKLQACVYGYCAPVVWQ